MTPSEADRISTLEAEIAYLRSVIGDHATNEHLAAVAVKLRRKSRRSGGGKSCAAILIKLLARAGKIQSREALFCATRNAVIRDRDTDSKVVNVQMVTLRKSLTAMGFPNVIHTETHCGWCITIEDANRIRTALGI